MKIISNSEKETKEIAKKLVIKILNFKKHKGAVVLGLSGDLGTGKTIFTKNFAKALGVKETVKSPTFNIMKRYKAGDYFLYHLDVYRINNPKDILDLGWREIIDDSENIVIVEWAEKVRKILPKGHFWLKLSHLKEGSRGIDIKEVK